MVGIMRPHSFWKPDVAVDLGTAWIRVAYGAHGLHAAPSVYEGRGALRAGVVVDRDAAIAVLGPRLAMVRRFGVVPPRAIAGVPSDVSARERDAVRECILKAGASDVFLVPEPLAAAIGSGVDVASPFANMILDIGEGVTDCAVIRSGRLVEKHAERVGCGDLRRAAMKAGSRAMKRSVSRDEAEKLVRAAGVVRRSVERDAPEIFVSERVHGGRDVEGRYRDAVEPLVEKMIGVAVAMLGRIEPSLGCEIIENGIWLTGGGSLLEGMRARLEDATRIRVNPSPRPLEDVVRGAHVMLPIVSLLNGWKT
jgi:rod shape-determining protein MreB